MSDHQGFRRRAVVDAPPLLAAAGDVRAPGHGGGGRHGRLLLADAEPSPADLGSSCAHRPSPGGRAESGADLAGGFTRDADRPDGADSTERDGPPDRQPRRRPASADARASGAHRRAARTGRPQPGGRPDPDAGAMAHGPGRGAVASRRVVAEGGSGYAHGAALDQPAVGDSAAADGSRADHAATPGPTTLAGSRNPAHAIGGAGLPARAERRS